METTRISIKEWAKEQGYTKKSEVLNAAQEFSFDGICPALCSEGCEVEPDGECEHGCPSLLIALGVI